MWGSLGGLNEEPVGWQGWIFYMTLPFSLTRSLFESVVKWIQWCHCLPFCQATSLLCNLKNTKTSFEEILNKNIQFIWVSLKTRQHTSPENIFHPVNTDSKLIFKEPLKQLSNLNKLKRFTKDCVPVNNQRKYKEPLLCETIISFEYCSKNKKERHIFKLMSEWSRDVETTCICCCCEWVLQSTVFYTKCALPHLRYTVSYRMNEI